MYINGMPFLTTISKNIKYHTAIWVADCTAPTIAFLVESVLKLYQWASFQVTEVCADWEFKPHLHILQDSGWSFMTNLANAQEHVPEAECNNHVLKEHIHVIYHGIPYKMLPRNIICYLVMEITAKIITFLPKVGAQITSAQGKFSIVLSWTTRSTVLCLFSVMLLLMMNPPLPTLLMCMHWIVFSYAPFTQSKVDISVIIFPLARPLHNLTSLLFPPPCHNYNYQCPQQI